MRKFSRRTVASGVAIAIATTSGIAWANWISTGTGTGKAKAGQAIKVDVSGNVTDKLVPGRTADLKVTVTNQNPYKVRINRVRRTAAVTADASHPGCVTTGVVFPVNPVTDSDDTIGVEWRVNGKETKTFTVAGEVRMTNGSDNGCQGATFAIPLRVVAEIDKP